MKILWVVNILFPYPAQQLGMEVTVFGGWMLSLLNEIINEKNVKKIAIVTTYKGSNYLKYSCDNVTYYLVPCKNREKYNKNVTSMFKQIYNDFKPDLIHIHGTEYPHSLSAIESSCNIKTLVSVQGLVSVCGIEHNYNAGITKFEMLKNVTLRDLIKNDFLFTQSLKFKKKGRYEEKTLKECDYIIGRTSWDEAYTYDICHQNKYKKCNESLRENFYNCDWDIKKIKRHSIFVSQASYPLKGFHVLLKSASILKKKYPDLKIYVAGVNIVKFNSNSILDKMKLTGYGKYILKLINKYNLKNNIEFLGLLDEIELSKSLLKSHVFVQASSIENSSNSLGEAMISGMPIVASYVGGTSDMLIDKSEGLLYPFGDYVLLAKYIRDVFEDDQLAVKLGINAKRHALIIHDRKDNCNNLINIYKEVCNKK